MTGKPNEILTTDLSYPMVDLLTGTIMPLMYLNTLAVCCLLPLTSPERRNIEERTREW